MWLASSRPTITASQAAAALDVTTMTISRMCHDGLLEHYRITPAHRSPIRIYADSLIAFAKKQQKREITIS